MIKTIEKRDGRTAEFNIEKIANAIFKAAHAAANGNDYKLSKKLALQVEEYIEKHSPTEIPTVEYIQDVVEKILIENGYARTAKAYILYRNERSRAREMNTNLMKIYEDLTFKTAIENDVKRENANIDADTSMGTMLKYGSEGAKRFNEIFLLEPHIAKAHREGDIHIHDFDFYTLTTTCTQIDLLKLFKNGFSTGHGFLREPNSIRSYSALACIAIQANQNDQHGGQSVPNFDYCMAPGVAKTYFHNYKENLRKTYYSMAELNPYINTSTTKNENNLTIVRHTTIPDVDLDKLIDEVKAETNEIPRYTLNDSKFNEVMLGKLEYYVGNLARPILDNTIKFAEDDTMRETQQAMEALVHNLNTMHSRAGAQIPFSSLNYGTDTSPEGRLVMYCLLSATDNGLGHGETPIFPIQIFKVKEGVNYNPGDPNYDLFKKAIKVSAKRLFPNFSFLDAPFNKQFYKEGHPETEVAYMGCRTRVMSNIYAPDKEVTYGRGNLSFTSVNLPRLGIEAKGDIDKFFKDLDAMVLLVIEQLKARFKIQSNRRVYNYPFLMGQGIWLDSDKLAPDDKVGEVLKHGTLTVGFIGLAECLKALIGKHHGESEEAQELGLKIISRMRELTDKESQATGLNFSLIATPAEGLSGRFIRIDKQRYGIIEGVTDRDYYTNSFHVPVYYQITAFKKIKIEAPYHAITNGGHISYVELDGDPSDNLDAFEAIIRLMKECGIGYGSINHPVDRDPICGYTGVINDICPRCGRREGEPVTIKKLQELGLYRNLNADTLGYHGDPYEEQDREVNPYSAYDFQSYIDDEINKK